MGQKIKIIKSKTKRETAKLMVESGLISSTIKVVVTLHI